MQPRDVARIECRSASGLLVAVLEITSDIPDSGIDALAGIIEIDASKDTQMSESRFQLRENGRYFYEVHPCNDGCDLRLRSHLSRRRPRLPKGQRDAGTIETGSFCGTLLVELVDAAFQDERAGPVATAFVDIRSLKLDYRKDYRGMLADITARLAGLAVDARLSTKMPFRSTFAERSDPGWFQLQVELLRDMIDSADFAAAMNRIVTFPHEALTSEDRDMPVERPARWTARSIRQLTQSAVRRALPPEHPLARVSGLGSVATHLPTSQRMPTVDTPENQFVKHALGEFQALLDRAHRVFLNAGKDWAVAARLADRLSGVLHHWLARSFFQSIGPPRLLPLGSPVLQRKPGYREVLQQWLRFRTGGELSWEGGEGLFFAGQRSVAELYEYWLFFALLDWFCKRFDRSRRQPLLQDLVEGLDETTPRLRLRKSVTLGPFTGDFHGAGRLLHAAFYYNREFRFTANRSDSGSWSCGMRPDYTISFWPAVDGMSQMDAMVLAERQDMLVHIHFDAKYRVSNLQDLFGRRDAADQTGDPQISELNANYKREDLLKMHAYRDAIRRTEGAYVLYPGDDACRRAQRDATLNGPERWRHVLRGFHEIIPGLGAFAVAPDHTGSPLGIEGDGGLATFLEDVLANLCERASHREVRAFAVYDSLRSVEVSTVPPVKPRPSEVVHEVLPELDRDSLRTAPSSQALVLCVPYANAAAQAWMLEKRLAVLHLGVDGDHLPPMLTSLQAVTHLLLYGRDDASPGLHRILDEAGGIADAAQLSAQGFPKSGMANPQAMFGLISFGDDHAFGVMPWSPAGIQQACDRFLAYQRPSRRKTLERLQASGAGILITSIYELRGAIVSSE
jgi:predicted component of viral defense system (DUF524 family)